MNDKLIIFDTTLRDGEQSPGASMNLEEKVRIARALERMGVDVIEAGFPIASDGDYEAVQAVSRAIKNSTICALARALDKDIDRAGEAIESAVSGRIHTFIATSPIHMQTKLLMTPEQVLKQAVRSVKRANLYTDDVEFSPEDAGRSDFTFLCEIIEAAIDAGATTINIPDTVGYNLPDQYGSLINHLKAFIPKLNNVILSVHCHDDLGMAVANSLTGVLNGARQVECTINGIGERAGNTALEEVVMAVKTRNDSFDCNVDHINTTEIVSLSKLVSGITGIVVQPNKAIVGANAFAHEAGIHQDGVLKNPETYEIMKAEDVGCTTNNIVLGKHSGRAALKNRLFEIGIELETESELNDVFKRFKSLADKKHEIFDEDLQMLITDSDNEWYNERYSLVSMKLEMETGELPVSVVNISVDGDELTDCSSGSGSVDATFSAIELIVHSKANLELYSVNNITNGTDSQANTTVRLSKNGKIVNGHGSDTDIVVASAKAYINALNKLYLPEKPHTNTP